MNAQTRLSDGTSVSAVAKTRFKAAGRAKSTPDHGSIRNKLLHSIPSGELARVLSISERVQLLPRQVLHDHMLAIEHVYFVESGLVSVAAMVGRGKFIEVWLTGSEGLVGAPVVLTSDVAPLHRRTVQVAGQALRIRTREFREALKALPTLRAVAHAYLGVLLVQTSQSGACNSVHSLKHRLARWLLLARSKMGADEIPLTHGVLAQLLGVRRASVTECLEMLENDGLIVTQRGLINICNFERLSHTCCGCFRLIDLEYQRQLAPFAQSGSPVIETETCESGVPLLDQSNPI
jgi:CRP-like cAMP-binding protein